MWEDCIYWPAAGFSSEVRAGVDPLKTSPARRTVLIDDGIPGEGFPDDPDERCGSCGRALWCVIEVVYDPPDDTEGGGVIAIG